MRPAAPARTIGRHVVLIHRYYQPDTPPYATILARIAAEVAASGHRVTVLTCQPSYNRAVVKSAPRREKDDNGVCVTRFRVLPDRRSTALKLVNALWFMAAVLTTVVRLGRVDTVMVASTPPVLEGLTGRVASRLTGARLVYHHQDIYPEVAGNLTKGGSWMGRVARGVDAATDRASDTVVVLSRDMEEVIASRAVSRDRIRVINNFDPWEYSDDGAPLDPTPSMQLRILYGGNLGRFQNLPLVFRTVVALRDEPSIRFTFVGNGPMSAELERLIDVHGLANVEYSGHELPDLLAERMRHRADVGLVTLDPGVIRAAYPSKVMSYLRNALPLLAVIEPGSELGAEVAARGAGWVVSPDDEAGLASTIRGLAADPAVAVAARPAARALYLERFSPPRALAQWKSLLTSDIGLLDVEGEGGTVR